MTPIGRKWKAAAMGLVVAGGAWFNDAARGQSAVAYTPQVSGILNGAAMQVTPVVSADRRYVRVSVNAYFNTVNGFSTYSAPLGAVSGGGSGSIGGGGGGGLGGGLGGLGGGGGAGAAGGGGVGAGGGFAGMNGPIGGMGMSGPTGPMMGYAQTGNYLAGDFPPAAAAMGMGGDGGNDPFGRTGVIPMQAGPPIGAPGDAAANAAAADPFGFEAVPNIDSMRPAKRAAASRKKAVRRSSRRPKTTANTRP